MDSNDILWTILDNPITGRREIYWLHTLKFFMTREIIDDIVDMLDISNLDRLCRTQFGHRVPQRRLYDVIWEDIKVDFPNDVYDGLKNMPGKFTPGLYAGELKWMSLNTMKSLIASQIKLKRVDK